MSIIQYITIDNILKTLIVAFYIKLMCSVLTSKKYGKKVTLLLSDNEKIEAEIDFFKKKNDTGKLLPLNCNMVNYKVSFYDFIINRSVYTALSDALCSFFMIIKPEPKRYSRYYDDDALYSAELTDPINIHAFKESAVILKMNECTAEAMLNGAKEKRLKAEQARKMLKNNASNAVSTVPVVSAMNLNDYEKLSSNQSYGGDDDFEKSMRDLMADTEEYDD